MTSEGHDPLDDRIAALGERIERLRQHVPPGAPTAPAKPAPSNPLGVVRGLLLFFVFVACVRLINDVVTILAKPDGHVFVSMENGKFHVWKDVFAYEAATGKELTQLPPGTTELVATYHDTNRDMALQEATLHLLLLALSILALYKLRQARRQALMAQALYQGEPGS